MSSFDVDPNIARARTIGTEFYTSNVLFDECREKIFIPSWQFIGDTDVIGQRGQCQPVTLLPDYLNEPLLLTHDQEGEINCLSNVCTHRGTIVVNGELICESGPDKQYGYLSTNKAYKNFVLTLQFKQEANGNSGLFFRSSIEGVKINGWQVEVAPLNHHTGGIYESYGREWLIQPKPEDEKWLKEGDWNKLKIQVINDEVTTWLNDHQMIYLKDEKIGRGEGFIALQIHDGGGIKVRWKDFSITELK